MRVLHVTDTYLPRLGGIEVHVSDLVGHQRAAGIDARVITPVTGDGSAPDPEWVHRTGRRPGKSPSLIVATLSTASSRAPVCGRRSPLGLESRTHEQVTVPLGSHSAGETPLSRGGLLLALHLQGRQNTLLQRTGSATAGEQMSVCGASPSRESLHGAGKSSGAAATLSYSGSSKRCPQRDSNPCYRLERAASWATRRWGRAGFRVAGRGTERGRTCAGT